MTNQERDERYQKLMGMPVSVLIETIIKLEEQVALTKEYRKRLLQIRNLATDPGERRRVGRPSNKEYEQD